MKILIIMRHGHAENWARTDFDRKLTPEGQLAVNAAAVNLRACELTPDLILCSAAARALETARRVAALLDVDAAKIVAERTLYHIDDYELLRDIQHTAGTVGTLMVVGHNPTVSALASGLGGEMHSMRPAAMAVLRDGGGDWKTFGGNLISTRYF